MKTMEDIASFKDELKKKPNDTKAMRGLAKAYVHLGDWPRALKLFAALGVEAAAFELNPADAKGCNALKAADFWWECSTKNPKPYRIHAAALYRRAIGEGLVDGLLKTIVENRIAEAEAAAKMAALPVSGAAASGGPRSVAATDGTKSVPPAAATTAIGNSRIPKGKRYCIIDLSPGPNAQRYAVSWRDTDPASSGWQDMYKTTKLVLRRIEPGTFIMGENQKDGAPSKAR